LRFARAFGVFAVIAALFAHDHSVAIAGEADIRDRGGISIG
jgi:hypothetical protein